MPIELSSEKTQCYQCGTVYGRKKGYFPVSYAVLHRGVGYVHVCKECIERLYNTYLAQCDDQKAAVRQVCRKLDLFWSESVYELVSKKATTKTIMTQYMAKVNSISYAGKSYDDTLSAEGTLWSFAQTGEAPFAVNMVLGDENDIQDDEPPVDENVKKFWGSGYSNRAYAELEERKSFYISQLPKAQRDDLDVGSISLIRQICNLESVIARDSAAGKPIDKSVNSLNTLLGSLNVKPTQRKDDDLDAEMSSTPLGVWLYKFENKRPLPDVEEDLKDVKHLKRYIFTWMGHLCKMLGVKNGYTRLYEDEISRLRVERPEYEDEDDESLIIDSYADEQDAGDWDE